VPGEEHDTGAPPGVLMVAKALPKGGMSGCDPDTSLQAPLPRHVSMGRLAVRARFLYRL